MASVSCGMTIGEGGRPAGDAGGVIDVHGAYSSRRLGESARNAYLR
jgi:hypothetical protein